MDLNQIPPSAYTLIGVVIGACGPVFTNWMRGRHQRKQETEKLHADRQNVLHKDFSQRFQSLANDLAAVAHCMWWFTWWVTHDKMNDEIIKTYDKEIHDILPKLLGDYISVAAVDKELGLISKEFVDHAHQVYEEIGTACLAWKENRAEGMKQLKSLDEKAKKFDDEVYDQLAEFAAKRYSEFLNEPVLESRPSSARRAVVALAEAARNRVNVLRQNWVVLSSYIKVAQHKQDKDRDADRLRGGDQQLGPARHDEVIA